MKYLLLLLIVPFWYTFSFARFNWKEKNRLGAAGAVIILLVGILLPLYMFFFRQT